MRERPNAHGVPQRGQPSCKRPVAGYLRSATELDDESIRVQLEAVVRYARERNFQLIRIYCDECRSGLRIDDRPGLQQLFRDIKNGAGDFDAVLLFDPSRWGRFVDPHGLVTDEFARRRAGMEIHYCADQLRHDGRPVASIVKAIKRTMAREYDRELVCRERRGIGAVVRRMAAAANECAGTDRAKDSGVRSGAPMPARKEPAPG